MFGQFLYFQCNTLSSLDLPWTLEFNYRTGYVFLTHDYLPVGLCNRLSRQIIPLKAGQVAVARSRQTGDGELTAVQLERFHLSFCHPGEYMLFSLLKRKRTTREMTSVRTTIDRITTERSSDRPFSVTSYRIRVSILPT